MSKIIVFVITVSLFVSCAHNSPQKKFSETFEREKLESLLVRFSSLDEERQKMELNSLYLKANFSFMQREFKDAELYFSYLSRLTKDLLVSKKYVATLIRLGKLAKAKDELERVVDKEENDQEDLKLILAGLYGSLNELKKSEKTYQDILAGNPKHQEACLFLGKLYVVDNKVEKAIKHFEKCAQNNPRSGEFYYWKGKVLQENGKEALALKYFNKALKVDKDHSPSHIALGFHFEKVTQYNKALDHYKKAVETQGASKALLGRIVNIYFLEENYEQAIPYVELLVDIDPADLNNRVKLGILYTDIEAYQKAKEVLLGILKEVPNSDKILYYLGAIYQEEKKLEEAIEYFGRIPVSSGLYTDSSLQIANMLNSLAQVEHLRGEETKWQEKLTTHLDKSFKHNPKVLDLALVGATFHEAIGEYDKAISYIEKVRSEPDFGLSYVYYLASLYEKNGDYQASTKIVMNIIEEDPQNAQAWNFLGYSLLERGNDLEKAFEYISKAVSLNPKDGYIRDSLGWYHYKTGNNKQALKELTTAFSLVPDDAVISKHLAIIYSDKNEFAKAQVYLNHALKHTTDPNEIQNLLKMKDDLVGKRLPASGK